MTIINETKITNKGEMSFKMNNKLREQIESGPARRIKSTRRSVSGRVMFNGEKAIPYESSLERDFIIRHSFSPKVLDIHSQPLQIKYTGLNGRSYTYTPDYLVLFKDTYELFDDYQKPLLVEVKYREELLRNWSKLKPKFKAARQHAHELGAEFRIYDEYRIRDQAFDNIMFLRRYKKMSFDELDTERLISRLSKMGRSSFDYLLSSTFYSQRTQAVGISHIWHLVSTGKIKCYMHLPLGRKAVLWVSEENSI